MLRLGKLCVVEHQSHTRKITGKKSRLEDSDREGV